jgi:phosphoglycerate dehydrogenase-like enzyme
VVSLHTPWLPETEGLVNAALLRSMIPGSTLINTARGAIINESDLITVLGERADMQVILDVTHPEPPANGSPLYQLPNVLMTPHIAGSIDRECARMGMTMIDECARILSGEPPRYAISREKSLLMA